MNLTKEHIGKKMRLAAWPKNYWFLIEWLRDESMAGVNESGIAGTYIRISGDWEFYEEEKKPSERIQEIRSMFERQERLGRIDGFIFNVIGKYLDEQWEKN